VWSERSLIHWWRIANPGLITTSKKQSFCVHSRSKNTACQATTQLMCLMLGSPRSGFGCLLTLLIWYASTSLVVTNFGQRMTLNPPHQWVTTFFLRVYHYANTILTSWPLFWTAFASESDWYLKHLLAKWMLDNWQGSVHAQPRHSMKSIINILCDTNVPVYSTFGHHCANDFLYHMGIFLWAQGSHSLPS
jgi:hypothetical protein